MRATLLFLLSLTLTIPLAAQRSPYAGVIPIPGTVQAENYDHGGEGVAWHDTTPGNAFGVYRLDDMDVGPITAGGYFIGAIDVGEWAEYSVNVATAGNYSVTVRWASAYPSSTTFHILMNGVNVSGTQTITSTGDWQTFTTKTFTASNLQAGPQILRISFDTGSWNLDSLQFTAIGGQRSPYAGVIPIPGLVQAENYDNGGEGLSWHDTTPGNAFGVYRLDDMDVGPITAGGYFIGAIDVGEWAEYSVNVATAGAYNVTVRWASAYPSSTTFHLLMNGVNVSGTQTITSTGDWQTFTTKTFATTSLAAGNQILRVSFDTGSWNLDSLQFVAVPACTAPTVTNPVATTVDPDTTATFSVTGTGSPTPTYRWYKDGIALSDDGRITGSASPNLSIALAEIWRDGGSYTVKATNTCNTATSAGAQLRIPCGNPAKPGMVAENISRALRFPGLNRDTCDWAPLVSMGFTNNVYYGGSYNLPVVAAAVAFIKQPSNPPNWDMNSFWNTYLSGELGDRGSSWFYGGLELGSADYSHNNVMAVLGVHYWAHQTGNTTIEALAKRWLRATFALDALAAVPQLPLTLHAKGQMLAVTANYTGPFIAMEGERSAWGFWMYLDRDVMFAHAVGLATNSGTESPAQNDIRTYVEGWSGVYGLTAAEKTYLQNVVNNRTLVPYADGGSIPYLKRDFFGNLHPASAYQFMAWPRVKATVLEQSLNNNTVATFGTAYFLDPYLANGREAHFLYPWSEVFMDGDAFKNGVCGGTAFIDLANHLMSASHPDCPPPKGSKVTKHPAETVTIGNLPAAAPNYIVTLDPTAAPVCTPACP